LDWNLWEAVIRVLISLPIICLAAYLFIKYGLAKQYPRSSGSLRVMEQISLSSKASVSIIKAGDEYLLVSATESQVEVIKPMENYQPLETGEFQLDTILKRFQTGRGNKHAS